MTLNCFKCDQELQPVFPDISIAGENQPSGGTVFISYGQYGSTVWDPCDFPGRTFLEINLCDKCLKKNATQVAFVTKMERTDYTYKMWVPDEDGVL